MYTSVVVLNCSRQNLVKIVKIKPKFLPFPSVKFFKTVFANFLISAQQVQCPFFLKLNRRENF